MLPLPHLLFLLLAFLSPAVSRTHRHPLSPSQPPPPPPPLPAGGGSTSNVLTAAALSAACLVVLLILYLCIAIAVRRLRGTDAAAASSAAARTAAFLRRHGLHQRPTFTYEQLRAATGGFDPRRKLGDGGFGSVFRADLGGAVVAVKRLHLPPSAAAASSASSAVTKSFCTEILILSALRHSNLVRLHGFCADPRALLLVYDFAPNGTLSDHLHRGRGRSPLSWPTRLAMAAQIAAALEYLHFGVKPPVVHRDVTSSNIFVEADMRARLGDFGLSRLLTLPDACSTAGSRELVCCTGPQGTPGYLDPDYHRSFRLTEKSDVYSFGVVLLELVTGMRPVDVRRERRDVTLADWAVAKIQLGELREVVDPALVGEGQDAMASIEAVAELAFRCVAMDKDDRPNAREASAELRRIQAKLLEVPSKGS